MVVSKTKKNALTGLCCTLFSFLLLTLSGCDTTSDPRVYYQPTGSWQGTIGADQVRGIIAPDRTYHLAIVDGGGNSVGEYVGQITSIDTENIGSMTLTRLHTTEAAGAQQQFTFKLSADRLYSLQGMELARTAEANGPAAQGAVAGHWSLTAADNLTDVVVNTDGTLSGSDGINCNYSGSLQLLTPSWNIFSLNITLSDIPGGTCNNSDYSGLAMLLPPLPENGRRRLWLAANNRILGGVKTFFGEWAETVNVAPVAQMTILGERVDQSVLVKAGAAVELDAQGSSDANNDALTYEWKVTYPGGNTLILTGSTVEFVPDINIDIDGNGGLYSLELTVSDGIEPSLPLIRTITVEWTLDRFIDCTNGTVLDTRTNLLWLQDAWCVDLNDNFGVNPVTALSRINALAAPACGLSDGSALGDWKWPTRDHFRQIVTITPFPTPPALLNDTGDGQWIEGVDAFTHVGTTPVPPYKIYTYWTSDPAPDGNWYFVNFAHNDQNPWVDSSSETNINPVWPFRALRSGETCP